jgi:hypothetical protein
MSRALRRTKSALLWAKAALAEKTKTAAISRLRMASHLRYEWKKLFSQRR